MTCYYIFNYAVMLNMHARLTLSIIISADDIVNPRRAYAARVTVINKAFVEKMPCLICCPCHAEASYWTSNCARC